MSVRTAFVLVIAACATLGAQPPQPTIPKGFVSLFNGKDLSGWRGRQPNYNPAEEAKLSKEALAEKQAQWNIGRDAHWKVDGANREIVSDGESPHLATEREYGDFELYVDWRMVSAGGDSGVYLRGYPQVQVWDPDNAREVKNGAPRGSGGLWNNNPDNPGRWPLTKADRPVGQWNTFIIKMIGSRVWITLNGTPTVEGQVLDNYFERTQPVVAKGPIELQTHGSEIRFRNLYVREVGAEEARSTLARVTPPPR